MLFGAASLCLLAALLQTVSAHSNCQTPWCIDDNITPALKYTKPIPIEDYIKQYGYPLESHEIRTEDGYLLTYHRIPRGKDRNKPQGRPVLVHHGLLGASSCWVLSEQSLAFSLADAGFDVWLANGRGNTYSKKHVRLDPKKDKKKYWNFSWHEIGYYDLPAAIDYILKVTGKKQVLYIGYSMGTTTFLVLGAMKPQYMDKVQAAVLLAPVVYPWNIRSPLSNFMNKLMQGFHMIVKATGVYEMLPYSSRVRWVNKNFCAQARVQFICRDLIQFFGGYQKSHNRIPLSTVVQYSPAGASYKQIRHFRQLTKIGRKFRQYDYGHLMNLRKYRSLNPPKYDLSRVTAPTYVYYAVNDWQAVPQDVFHAIGELPNVVKVVKVPEKLFNHIDFMWAVDAKQLLYDDIISTLHEVK